MVFLCHFWSLKAPIPVYCIIIEWKMILYSMEESKWNQFGMTQWINNDSIFVYERTIPSYIPHKWIGWDLKSDDKSGFLSHLFLKFGRPSDQIGCVLWIRRDTICNLVFSQLTFPGCLFLSLPLRRGLQWIKYSYFSSLWFRFKPRVCVFTERWWRSLLLGQQVEHLPESPSHLLSPRSWWDWNAFRRSQ